MKRRFRTSPTSQITCRNLSPSPLLLPKEGNPLSPQFGARVSPRGTCGLFRHAESLSEKWSLLSLQRRNAGHHKRVGSFFRRSNEPRIKHANATKLSTSRFPHRSWDARVEEYPSRRRVGLRAPQHFHLRAPDGGTA